MKTMPRKFLIEIYCAHSGIRMDLPWWDEEQFKAGGAFLRDMVGPPTHHDEPGEPDCYYLETEDQFEAIMQFRREQGVRRPD